MDWSCFCWKWIFVLSWRSGWRIFTSDDTMSWYKMYMMYTMYVKFVGWLRQHQKWSTKYPSNNNNDKKRTQSRLWSQQGRYCRFHLDTTQRQLLSNEGSCVSTSRIRKKEELIGVQCSAFLRTRWWRNNQVPNDYFIFRSGRLSD